MPHGRKRLPCRRAPFGFQWPAVGKWRAFERKPRRIPGGQRHAPVLACAVPRTDREPDERRAAAAPLGGCCRASIAARCRPADAVAQAARPRRGLERTHREALRRRRRDPMLPEPVHAPGMQPGARFPEPLPPRPVRGLPQRMPAAPLASDRAQQALRRLFPSRPSQRSAPGGQLPTRRRAPRRQPVPVLVPGRSRHRVAPVRAIRNDGAPIKLALAGPQQRSPALAGSSFDECPAGYSRAARSPAGPAAASPTGAGPANRARRLPEDPLPGGRPRGLQSIFRGMAGACRRSGGFQRPADQ